MDPVTPAPEIFPFKKYVPTTYYTYLVCCIGPFYLFSVDNPYNVSFLGIEPRKANIVIFNTHTYTLVLF